MSETVESSFYLLPKVAHAAAQLKSEHYPEATWLVLSWDGLWTVVAEENRGRFAEFHGMKDVGAYKAGKRLSRRAA